MNRTPLHELHATAGARFAEVAGWETPVTYGDLAAEYRAATEGAVVMDRSSVGRFQVTGKDALDLLNRLTSNKVDPLPPGTGAGTLLTTNKGRVIDLLHLFSTDAGLLMLTSPQTRRRVAEWIDAYTFAEEISLEDTTESTSMVTLLGPGASDALKKAVGGHGPALEPYGSAVLSIAEAPVQALRSDLLGTVGYDLIVSSGQGAGVWRALAQAGAVPVGEDAFNLLRVEAGIPRYGWEISEGVNPWEAGLAEYIHFAKGCYIGQEVVLRLHTYQKVQRALAHLTFSGPGVQEGAKLLRDGKEVGVVTTVAQHPLGGACVGLGLVRAALAGEEAKLAVAEESAPPGTTAKVLILPSDEI
ncbi:MAG: aminomethyl transferase family protein [Chloroflexi bacterium]|nr:aminomethyl transferase family protein [Chloroflexota bacterium]